MATHRPVVLSDGELKQLPIGDTILGASGGGASATYGIATIDFGSYPGSNEASIVVSDIGITSASKIQVFIVSDDTTIDHTSNDHKYASLLVKFVAGDIVNATSFTIYALCAEKMQGTFKVRYAYAE